MHACRYTGLLDASIAAFQRARRLDPAIRTSVSHSFFLAGEYERAIEFDRDDPPYLSALALVQLGRTADAAAICRRASERTSGNDNLVYVFRAITAVVQRDRVGGRAAIEQLLSFPAFTDPEGLFYWTLECAGIGELERAFELLAKSVDSGLHCPKALEVSPGLHFMRQDPRFAAVLARARERHFAAADAFAKADGHHLLGLSRPQTSQH